MIVVVGGTGFIGAAIVRELAGRGERVVVMSHAATAPVMRLGEFTRGRARTTDDERAA